MTNILAGEALRQLIELRAQLAVLTAAFVEAEARSRFIELRATPVPWESLPDEARELWRQDVRRDYRLAITVSTV